MEIEGDHDEERNPSLSLIGEADCEIFPEAFPKEAFDFGISDLPRRLVENWPREVGPNGENERALVYPSRRRAMRRSQTAKFAAKRHDNNMPANRTACKFPGM